MNLLYHNLSKEDIQKLKDAIPLITVLIAGSDGNIDEKERSWAEKITGIRAYAESDEYKEFYTEVGQDFQKKLDTMIQSLPSDVGERSKVISERLTQLNPVLSKMDPRLGSRLYKEFKKFAGHVAKASGGFLGFFTLDKEEAKWVALSMLNPIEYDEDLLMEE